METLIRLKDFFVENKKEHIQTLFLTAVLLYLINVLNIYNDFFYFEEGIKNILLCLIGGYIGLIGFSISGIAIITGLFNKEHLKMINKKGDNKLDKIMTSYNHLSTMAVFIVLMLLMLYIALCSPRNLVNFYLFWIIEFVVLYSVVFSLLYASGLVKLTIKLYAVKNIYDKVIESDNSLKNDINEIKIDVLFKMIMEKYNIELVQLVAEIEELIESSEYKDKENLKKYIQSQYNIK